MKCTFCDKEIVLVPSARERSAKDRAGNTAAYYTSLFTSHSDCLLQYRRDCTSELIARKKAAG